MLTPFFNHVGLKIATAVEDGTSEYVVSGTVNWNRIELFDKHLKLIAEVVCNYDKDKVNTLLKHRQKVFDLALTNLGIDLTKAKLLPKALSHDTGIYDEKWIVFALQEIVSENVGQSLGM